MNKKEIRQQILQQLKDFKGTKKMQADKYLADQLFATAEYQYAHTIALVLSFNHEVNTFPIIEQALQDGKSVYVPEMDYKSRLMTFKEIDNINEIAKDKKGIYYTTSNGQTTNELDLIVVPGVGFQQNGYRIGYGGGYYDKFLSAFPTSTISLLYDFQLTTFDPESFDQVVDKLIIYRTS
ncbi:5-formyltetrahydrofolate cyclo-ligase [Staphylococcus simiae]|uniref:5-formyltetrahydrofolate cyclo-ligase n=1 Tax=Staphylococcus simiae TaxID=308354 RepID=UPI001A9757C6|nr:5-formyltetrahydrofolate cyclo-ligase [Staphylococcus simiae]MBO1197946.1 5-formyltetrahydrofolate cyclo-ligase [Staphylococcus simiae]MBO1200423.1 5-formyltetrahydrofolate cyclo-ligase [Staphylococcus simiae]MBO1202696.1 5-formyltetrahydrofolate cyclo-ligase [Staphylococcus simiae]MBO1209937.1 5-formyltetrahydrofolate cyclo-ligase [Staphylococcus simiae]MBO1228840.1 5-formyltetrahydrofolate cyclo-ligase [Staphylococcus simiae]